MEGNRKGKSGTGRGKTSSAQDFLGFHYERPVNTSPHGSSSSKKVKKSQTVVATKAEYVQASFRFIVSALSSPYEAAWYDPDALIPWETVECVVVPLNQENTLLCPICLDTVSCPRITKCGHTFCITCILRHMECDRSNSQKCPMCMEYIFKSDLRHAMFMYDHLDAEDVALAVGATGDTTVLHPFYVFKPYRGQITRNLIAHNPSHHSADAETAASTSSKPTHVTSASSSLQLQHPYTFHHLVVEKGNCRPYLPDKLLRFLLGNPSLAVINPPKSIATNRRATSTSSTTSTTSVVAILSEHLQELSRVLPNEICEEEVRFARIFFRPLALTFARWQEEELIFSSRAEELLREGDREASLYIQKASEMIRQQREDKIKRLHAQFYVDIPDLYALPTPPALPPLVGSSDTEVVAAVEDEGGEILRVPGSSSIMDNDALYQHVYQSVHGDAVYLHPLCQRALQAEFVSSRGKPMPSVISGKVIDIEYIRLGGSNRDKPAYLRHLPAYSALSIVEIDMKKLVSKDIYDQFASEFTRRQQKRRDKKKQEQIHERQVAHKHRKREAEQYQLYRGDDACVDDYTYSQYFAQRSSVVAGGGEDVDIAAIEAAFAASSASESSPSPAAGAVSAASFAQQAASAPVASSSRFAEVAQQNGHFPSLGDSSSESKTTGTAGVATGSDRPSRHDISAPISSYKAVSLDANLNKRPNSSVLSSSQPPLPAAPPLSTAAPSRLSLVANKRTTASSSVNSNNSTSRVMIRSAMAATASAIAASNAAAAASSGSGGFTFTLEDALKNSRGKQKKAGKKPAGAHVDVSSTNTLEQQEERENEA